MLSHSADSQEAVPEGAAFFGAPILPPDAAGPDESYIVDEKNCFVQSKPFAFAGIKNRM